MKVKSESEVAQSFPTPSDPMDCRLLHPWDFPGKSTGVGCHRLLRLLYEYVQNEDIDAPGREKVVGMKVY